MILRWRPIEPFDWVHSLAVAATRRHAPPTSGGRSLTRGQRGLRPAGQGEHCATTRRRGRDRCADPQKGGRARGHPPSVID
ncbi:MAG: hypothetical protein H0U76_18920 [Ktedonobacteraceae bacterium]|nr:hypothetical protein [Ktedonobacteraceae bacterium]